MAEDEYTYEAIGEAACPECGHAIEIGDESEAGVTMDVATKRQIQENGGDFPPDKMDHTCHFTDVTLFNEPYESSVDISQYKDG